MDDRWENQSVLISLLEPLDFIVIGVNNGREGLDKMKDALPHLIITDLMMPKMDGYQMLRQVRQIPELKDIPAIDQQIEILEKGDGKYQPFLQELRHYVDEFQIDKTKMFLERYIDMGKN